MPSPFPGMDPYLEQTDWVSVHVHLGVEIARYLSPLLRPKYVVRAEKIYVYSTDDDEDLQLRRPDVSVRSTSAATLKNVAQTATLEPPLHVSLAIPHRVPQITLEIRDVERRSLVTAIEILSMSNKRGMGRKKYLAKRNQTLASDTHLIELDLLRAGAKMPAVTPLPGDPYLVLLSRTERRPVPDVWPISLRSQLPVIPVPLRGDDADVELDLQKVFNTLYDTYAYELEIDYDAQLKCPLTVEDTAWARQRIADHKTWLAK